MNILRFGILTMMALWSGLALGQANTASLLDLTSNTVISNFVVGDDPQGVTYAGATVAYVVNDNDNTLVRLDMSTSPPSITATFTFPAGFGPHAIAVNPAGTRALVAGDGTSLFLINLTTTPFTIADTITVVADAGGVAIFAAGTRGLVANEANLLVLDLTTTPAGVTTVPLPADAHAVAVNALGTRAVVSLDLGGMQVIDLTTSPPSLVGAPIGPNPADPLGIAISPDGTRAIYVDEQSPAGQANVINIVGTPALVNSVPLTTHAPSAVAFNPITGAVLIAGDDGVSILNPPYTSVTATILHPGRRGAGTYTLAVNPAGTRALVLHEDALFCAPEPIDFGNVVVSTTSTRFETCQNTGSSSQTVTSIAIAGGSGFALSFLPLLPLVVPPGGTFTFNVTFTPPSLGPQAATLSVAATGFSSDVDIKGVGVVAVSTSTAVVSSVNPSVVGQSVTFTATVTGSSPTGTVQFKDGAANLGAPVALAGGSAAFTTSALSLGTHPITAVYSGDLTNFASTSPILSQVVNAAPPGVSTTSVASSLNPSVAGQSVTFTATVTGSSPTGTVQFKDGAANLGAPVTLAGGAATFTTSALTQGTHSITAVYSGDAANLTSTSPVLSQVVNAPPPGVSTTSVASSLNPSVVGQSVTFFATVTGNSPTGTVQFKDGAANLGAPVTLVGGNAAFTTPALTQGTHSITAVYSGDAANLTSTSPVLSQVVNAAPIASATPIPTLSEWAMLMMTGLLGWFGMRSLRSRRLR